MRSWATKVAEGIRLVPEAVTHPARTYRRVRDSEFRRRLDPRVETWEQQIGAAFQTQDWSAVIEMVRTAFRITGAIDTPEIRSKLITSHARLEQFEAVDKQLALAIRRHPESALLHRARAERAMMTQEYAAALEAWQSVSRLESTSEVFSARAFPARGDAFDWYERSWLACVEQWQSGADAGVWSASVETCRRMILTLIGIGELEQAARLSFMALKEHPRDARLQELAIDTIVRSSPDTDPEVLVANVREAAQARAAGALESALQAASVVIQEIRAMGRPGRDEVRLLTAYRHSAADLAVRAGNFWDEQRIHEESMRLAKRDGWPEQTAETDLLSERAWAEATRFAGKRARLVGVSPPALARATFHYFKQELTLKIPVDRVAKEIARHAGSEPVFIDLGAAKIPYMVSYPTGRMQTMYLYHALRKLGCNAVLVRFPRAPIVSRKERRRPSIVPMPTITLVPQPAQLKPPARPLQTHAGNPADIVVPAGIRSVGRVLERLDGAIVVNSGSAVKGLAYDRRTQQDYDYGVHISFHGDEKNLLPTFRIKTAIRRAWRRHGKNILGSTVAPSNTEPIEAFLSVGVWKVGDWHDWLERAIIPYFRDIVRRVRAGLQTHAVMDAHIGDYLYAESELVAAKVKDRGGRVHLWPHSTNPVHVPFHDPKHITSIRAVTRSGAAAWAQAMPGVEVVHDAGLMLEVPQESVPFTSGEPISVVVIGGRPVMRNLPILDIAAHERLYREFFASLDPLVRAGKVKVYFKPRGRTGEHETWLERLVGRSAGWQRVLEHPLRLQLPNPVFVSLSVGSSALLEGVSRGIPGLIVREGFARDYLAAEDGAVESLKLPEAIVTLQKLSSREEWLSVRAAQVAALKREIL